MGCSRGTISARLTKARQLLRTQLRGRGPVLTAGVLYALLARQEAAACMPIPLVASTIKAATVVATGAAATSVVSAKVAALMKGVLKAMLLTKLKIATLVLLALGIAVVSVGVLIHPTTAGAPPNAPQAPLQRFDNVDVPANAPMPPAPQKSDLAAPAFVHTEQDKQDHRDNNKEREMELRGIKLGGTEVNSVQIKAVKGPDLKTAWEIQLGGGSNQPPANTRLTGRASIIVDGKTLSGYFTLATEPAAQLRMIHMASGQKDTYEFLPGRKTLKFFLAENSSLKDPWVTAEITCTRAYQDAIKKNNRKHPGADQANQNHQINHDNQDNQNNQDSHAPIVLIGSLGKQTGGSLANRFAQGVIKLTLNVGGNQRLYDADLGNTHSGMKLQEGEILPPGLLLDSPPLKIVLTSIPWIFKALVEPRDLNKSIVVIKVVENLKGAPPYKNLLIVPKADTKSRGENLPHPDLLKHLGPKRTIIGFMDGTEGAFGPVPKGKQTVLLYIDGTWVRCLADSPRDNGAALPLQLQKLEPALQKSFNGTSEELRQAIVNSLSGKQELKSINPEKKSGPGPVKGPALDGLK